MFSIVERCSGVVLTPWTWHATAMPCMRPSQGAWNGGSSASATTGPRPCLPPTSWILSMAVLLLKLPARAGSAAPTSGEKTLFQDGVYTQVSVHDLRDAEISRDRHQ